MTRKIIQLVDSNEYIQTNCFQHQLSKSLHEACDLTVIEIGSILRGDQMPEADGVVSCLKQRSVLRHIHATSVWLKGRPVVVYDQDPWHSYMDDSEYKGSYNRIMLALNVKTFALTTKWWVDLLHERGLPSTFVKMGLLPEYCNPTTPYEQRTNVAGFVGSVHPRRKQLLDVIDAAGIQTDVLATNSLGYASFLGELSKLRCFVHNEDMPIAIDGQRHNFSTGMWVKDIEAASQGCFSIRNKGEGSETYLDGIETVELYDSMDEVPHIIKRIEAMDPVQRQLMIDRSVRLIRSQDAWKATAQTLVNASVNK